MTDNDKMFVGHAILKCIQKNTKVFFEHKESVDCGDEIKCSGFFDESMLELHVATKKSQRDFFPIFVHEFCHFLQWTEGSKVYKNISGTQKDRDMWKWLNGDDIPMERVRKSIKAYQELELDCEKRVIQTIDEFNLSIAKSDYIKQSNIYILFYSLIKKTRKWYKYPPYNIPELRELVPDTLITNFKLPKEYTKIALKKCF
jgi:hypothetical protein